MQSLKERFNYEHRYTTPYHPEGNATMERFHQFFKRHLNPQNNLLTQDNWVDSVPKALMAYRTTIHDTTQETPFFLMHGRDMCTPMDIDLGTWSTSIATPDVRDFRNQLLQQQDMVIDKANMQRRLPED
jgi:hypothetical protein